jgi:hypothetical protein
MWEITTVLAAVTLALLGVALGWLLRRQSSPTSSVSPVTLQHLALYQAGQLDLEAVEQTKRRFERWLAHGHVERVLREMQPGTGFLVSVRALMEIGTEDACRILESQLSQRLCDDPLDQSWYWLDLANSLRHLQREQSLPLLLDCLHQADEFPLVQYLAAEIVSFTSFDQYLRDLDEERGRAALRWLLRALEGLRFGVPPQVLVEARLGDTLASLCEQLPDKPDPLILRLFRECQRLIRRRGLLERWLENDSPELEMVRLQVGVLESLQPVMLEYLAEQGPALVRQLGEFVDRHLRDALWAVYDLRLEAGEELISLYRHSPAHRDLIIQAMRWSRHSQVPVLLLEEGNLLLQRLSRVMTRYRFMKPRQLESDRLQAAAILFALRGHDSPEVESFLLTAAGHPEPKLRALALSSLGWQSLYQPEAVLLRLRQARLDPHPEVRQAARASLARLGERQALDWFSQALRSRDTSRVLEAIQTIVVEHITLLWPELDRLADADDLDIACLVHEGLMQMREELDYARPAR